MMLDVLPRSSLEPTIFRLGLGGNKDLYLRASIVENSLARIDFVTMGSLSEPIEAAIPDGITALYAHPFSAIFSPMIPPGGREFRCPCDARITILYKGETVCVMSPKVQVSLQVASGFICWPDQ